ncbi:unnamed protein product [Choristocarpus tenellus]
MAAIFEFSKLITVILLFICICTYLRGYRKGIFDTEDGSRSGFRGFCWKSARVGERLSPYVGSACVVMAVHVLFLK